MGAQRHRRHPGKRPMALWLSGPLRFSVAAKSFLCRRVLLGGAAQASWSQSAQRGGILDFSVLGQNPLPPSRGRFQEARVGINSSVYGKITWRM
jgi:hypothetical protein